MQDLIKKYQNESISKAELADKFFSPEFTELKEAFLTNTTAMKDLLTRYMDELYVIRDLLWAGYVDLWYMKPQIIDNQRMGQVTSLCLLSILKSPSESAVSIRIVSPQP